MTESFSPFGDDLFGAPIKQQASGPVAERFLVPPFSILDAKQGDWQERKRAWLFMNIEGELHRSGIHSYGKSCVIKRHGIGFDGGKVLHGIADAQDQTAASVFDPVLCELAYRWFCPSGGQVVDPFAGGSVRGIVAGALGRRYWGCDLRPEQIAANEAQADEIGVAPRPIWVCGDSMETLSTAPAADFVFSCPPYGDLEKYSDDPADLSNMEWHTFAAAYGRIIVRAVKAMKSDRFACFVVGDFRDKRGYYRDFVSTTIAAFRDAGADLYNEAILATSVGSASMRVTKQFNAGRKLCKTHQNVLVFCKGDWRKATAALVESEVEA